MSKMWNRKVESMKNELKSKVKIKVKVKKIVM